ncbi:MAG: Fe-S cluster assembly ATPase SufC [Deltaproteobacteria bacterium]|nr:MAG: Fe-S cluster assembly ATPase SufC [Deltaproteobacteria bacterium]
MLNINQLTITLKDKLILDKLSLEIHPGEIHVIMGPNGSGKSTLAQVLAGNPIYNVSNGFVLFKGENLLNQKPELRSLNGLFLAFQSPVEISGLNNMYFLKSMLNAHRKFKNLSELDSIEFLTLIDLKIEQLKIEKSSLGRNFNNGFSGGEKKMNEMLQILLLEPDLIILDEIDSGLDIDALKLVMFNISSLLKKQKSFIIITHYTKVLEYIQPNFVHILSHGKIVKSGTREIAFQIEQVGYENIH